ncbi:hypothetical protein BJS_04154 [Bradyrhizobium japonicum SEMIA 5079]|nr:hypothetical protein BJS_04154 [Bradyrhizobium japonicum SEMIA 5079]
MRAGAQRKEHRGCTKQPGDVFEIHQIRPPKGFPRPSYFGSCRLSARFRLFVPGQSRMACQPDTGKVKRTCAMLHGR